MNTAVLSDIHANIHALEADWEDLRLKKPDAVYCLGDLVGYGAFPNEVVSFVKDQQIPTVMGNFDEGVGFDLDDCGCVYRDQDLAELGRQSLLWSRENLHEVKKHYLQRLPIQIRRQGNSLQWTSILFCRLVKDRWC